MKVKKYPIDKIKRPFAKLMQEEKSGALVLGISIIIAFILANSPIHQQYHHFFEHEFGFYFDGNPYLEYSISEWINDGLMAIFFFVVGLELKREIVAGELSNIRKAMLPIAAAIGGMLVPAAIYLALNPTGEVHSGWGIPMATDIALALGVLYLLGNRVPLSIKVFLTALAIVDDLGAVLVIAFFYTSNISFLNLAIGFAFLLLMFIGNRMGVRSIIYYALIGIVGVWTAFILSGIHATIAAVLAAFMIPANVRIKESIYMARIKKHLFRFKNTDPDDLIPTLTNKQLHILERVSLDTKKAIPPLQRLEHAMTPFVNFIILPIFALANAGVTVFNIEIDKLFSTNVAIGVGLGLLVGKVLGIVGFSWLAVKLNIASFPKLMNLKSLTGLALLAAIGFTMSLFITQLAFTHEEYKTQAKIGIFIASIIGGLLGYLILNKQFKKTL
ncbi:Na+/H+ antiporter NhaA [Aequorivita sp. F64183]|uniref:Na(+)/H(+) antiporter NhaA n=2 Tax=Aequorivita xiaoshiensis TaxID=2874476 RepID=A0A9X1R4W3_9FLAO|nr:Na+/H+ antiporter NhaA [Aequorivita xiaoshiensis]MCG2431987.1 Na+/H+ antiporter NhaA [Aequorivita xiaoshiensis]